MELGSPGDLSPQQIGLPEKVSMLDTGCQQFFKAGSRLIFGDRGAYYEAVQSTPP